MTSSKDEFFAHQKSCAWWEWKSCDCGVHEQALCIQDVREAKLDREPWSGKVHEAIRLALAEQILRSIRDEQVGANSAVKGLAAVYFEVTG